VSLIGDYIDTEDDDGGYDTNDNDNDNDDLALMTMLPVMMMVMIITINALNSSSIVKGYHSYTGGQAT